jgi:hypothetical protein
MKKFLIITVIPLFVMACSNPLLKWIETAPDEPRTVSNSDKAISSFSFGIEGEAVLIRGNPNEDGKTPITVVLPANKDLSNLTPLITFIGKSINPRLREPEDFNSPVVYRVTAEDGSFRDYEVRVYVKTSTSNAIIWFDLESPQSGAHILAEGVISDAEGGTGKIDIRVPSGTDRTSLTAQIAQTGKLLWTPTGQTYSDTVIRFTGNFSEPSTYTVQAENGEEKEYLVTVSVDKDDTKAITKFLFTNNIASKDQTVLIGAVPLPDGKLPIVVTVPVSAD